MDLILFLKTTTFHQTFMKPNEVFYGNRVFKKIDNKWIPLRPYGIIVIYALGSNYDFGLFEKGPDLG